MEEKDSPLGAPNLQSGQPTDPSQPALPSKPKRKLNWKGFAIGIVAVIVIEFFAISMLNSPDPEIPIQPPQQTPSVTATVAPTAQNAEVLSVTKRGGLCAPGKLCSTITTVLSDGSVTREGKDIKKLSKEQITSLQQQIKQTDFEAIKQSKFTGTCPTAYDGQETVYTINSESTKEELPSCTYNLDLKIPLFSFIEANITQ